MLLWLPFSFLYSFIYFSLSFDFSNFWNCYPLTSKSFFRLLSLLLFKSNKEWKGQKPISTRIVLLKQSKLWDPLVGCYKVGQFRKIKKKKIVHKEKSWDSLTLLGQIDFLTLNLELAYCQLKQVCFFTPKKY